MRQTLNPLPTLSEGAPGEKNMSSALGIQNERTQGVGGRRGLAVPGGSPPGTVKTLTNILVEGVGGKKRHVRCVPRCPQGLPLDTAALKV